MRRTRGRIFKEAASHIWTLAGYPWAFVCYGCGRRAHHTAWSTTLIHSQVHDCTPGSTW